MPGPYCRDATADELLLSSTYTAASRRRRRSFIAKYFQGHASAAYAIAISIYARSRGEIFVRNAPRAAYDIAADAISELSGHADHAYTTCRALD